MSKIKTYETTKKESIETELSSISSDNDNQKDPKFSSGKYF